jgi:hypothetical protein
MSETGSPNLLGPLFSDCGQHLLGKQRNISLPPLTRSWKHPVSETLCFLFIQTSGLWTEIRRTIIVCVMYHLKTPFDFVLNLRISVFLEFVHRSEL